MLLTLDVIINYNYMTVHYLIILNDGSTSNARAYYETEAEASETAHSMQCGVFDNDDMAFEFIELEQD